MIEGFTISSEELQEKIKEYLEGGNVITKLPECTPKVVFLEKPVGKSKNIKYYKDYEPNLDT